MKGIVILFVIAILIFVIRKPLLMHFYLQLAIGRTTKLLRFLEQVLTDNRKKDEATELQMEWIHGQKLEKKEIRSRDNLTLTG